jgi:hypothetical protein
MRPEAPTRRGDSVLKRRARARQDIAFDASQFERTGNPVHAWDAITTCVAAGVALPQWTRRYLYEVGKEMTRLSRDRIPEKAGIDRAVAKAVGLRARGGFNPFRDVLRPGHEMLIAMDVNQCYQSDKDPPFSWGWRAVFDEVAKTHTDQCDECKKISVGKVKECWYRYKQELFLDM